MLCLTLAVRASCTFPTLKLTRGVVGFAIVSSADLLDQSFVVVSIKRHISMNQCVQKHAERPGVHLWAAVWPSVDDLWGGIQRAPAKRL